jgi:hypothetical protein
MEMRDVEVTVTEAHRSGGIPRDLRSCMVALALRDALGVRVVFGGCAWRLQDEPSEYYVVPEELWKLAAVFDRGEDLPVSLPYTVTISAPVLG